MQFRQYLEHRMPERLQQRLGCGEVQFKGYSKGYCEVYSKGYCKEHGRALHRLLSLVGETLFSYPITIRFEVLPQYPRYVSEKDVSFVVCSPA